MSHIKNLHSAPVITALMVRQAIQEAGTDESKVKELQTVCQQRPEAFEDTRQLDKVNQFVLNFYVDVFQFTPNSKNPAPAMASVTEARITKVVEREQTVQITPPAPPGRGWYRDPLNITGTAEAGAKVEFFNASQPGRPVIGEIQADPDGKFRFELTDETKFEFGDQIGIRVKDSAGTSEPVVVPTEPYQLTNTRTTYLSGSAVLRVDESSTLQALQANHDVRNPFYQQDKVKLEFTPPVVAGQPYTLKLDGGDDSVEPNSTLKVRINGKDFETKADKYGKFALKVSGFQPGERLKLEIKDINGKGIDVDYVAPQVQFNVAALAGAVARPPSPRKPEAREEVGSGPPWIHVKGDGVTLPFGAVVLKNRETHEVLELTADEQGRLNAAVGGVGNFDVFEVATRDANGNLSETLERFVLLPEPIKRGAPLLVPASELNAPMPDVAKVIGKIVGPPLDLTINGEKHPAGPFLKMPDLTGMPPFGQLAVMKDGKVHQYLRADKDGKIEGLLRGVHVGDQLNFQVLDAAGRKFPTELHGWLVPDAGKSNPVPKTHVHTEDMLISHAIGMIGSGELDVDQSWLTPLQLTSGPLTSERQPNVPLNYERVFFRGPETDSKSSFNGMPETLAQKFGISLGSSQEVKISIDNNQGSTHLVVDAGGSRGQVGIDYVMGRVNLANQNSPLQVPGHLGQLTFALKGSLGMVALAYEEGKEPGDMEYDRAMGAAKSILYVLDRLAVEHPDHKDAIVKAANDAIPAGGFAFELLGRDKVLEKASTSVAKEKKSGTSAMSLLAARNAQLGSIGASGVVGKADQGANAPPAVSQAVVVMPVGQNVHNAERTVPLRMKGTATPGDVVQIYNMSTAGRPLIGEAVVAPDGSYDFVGGSGQIALGDQLGVMSINGAGKKSQMAVVPTDSYTYTGKVADAKPIASAAVDVRQPFIRTGALELKNATYDANGNAKPGGPFWKLTGTDFAVEPFCQVAVQSTMPDGTTRTTLARADAEGKFELEFPGASRTRFQVNVTDRNKKMAGAQLTTPGLAVAVVTGDEANDIAAGIAKFKMADGREVRGVVVASSLGNDGSGRDENMTNIRPEERNDAFVDVRVKQNYNYPNSQNGQNQEKPVIFKIKIPAEQANLFTANVNQEVELDIPSLKNMLIQENSDVMMTASGTAVVLDRDFGMPVADMNAPAPAAE